MRAVNVETEDVLLDVTDTFGPDDSENLDFELAEDEPLVRATVATPEEEGQIEAHVGGSTGRSFYARLQESGRVEVGTSVR